MSAELDRLLEPGALAARAFRLRVATPLRDWLRLAALDPPAADAGRMVRVDIAFSQNDQGEAVVEGELAVTLRCTCQRCLEEMELEIRAQPKLCFGRAEWLDAAAVAAGFEPCEPEPGATLRQLLEDEMLLAVPVFPVHERSEDCGALAEKLAELEPAARPGKASPFAVLAELKRRN
jgi:uncharacterized protein